MAKTQKAKTASKAAAKPKKTVATTKVTRVKAQSASRVKLPNVTLLRNLSFGRLLAELVGTFVLTAVVLTALNGKFSLFTQFYERSIIEEALAQGQTPPAFIAPALFAAVTIGILVLVFGKISGAHINPAVTFGLWVVRKIKTVPAIFYIVSQLLGSMLAVVVVTKFVSSDAASKLITQINPAGGWKQFFAEALGAVIVGLGIASVAYGKKEGVEAAVTIGGAFFLGFVVAGLGSGALLNPAVAMGVGAIKLEWLSLAAYALGPVVGAAVGMGFYKLLHNDVQKADEL